MAETDKVQPANTEAEADRSGVITGDKASKQGDIQTPGKQAGEQAKTPEKELPLGKLGDNPRTGR